MKKTIQLNKQYLYYALYSFGIAIITVFVIEHRSKFSCTTDESPQYDSQGRIMLNSYIDYNSPASLVKMNTPFGSYLDYDGREYTAGDFYFTGGKFKPYSNRIKFYFRALLSDFEYVVYIGLGIFLLFVFFAHFKFKLT